MLSPVDRGLHFPKGSETVGGWLVLYGTSGDSVMPYVITFWSWDVNLCASPCCITDYSQPMLFWANVLTGSGSIVWQGDTSYWNQGLTVYVFDNYQDAANNWGTGDNAMFYGELSTQNGAELTGIPAGWLAVSGLNSQSTDAVLFMIMYFSAGEPLQFGADGPQAAVVVPNASLPPNSCQPLLPASKCTCAAICRGSACNMPSSPVATRQPPSSPASSQDPSGRHHRILSPVDRGVTSRRAAGQLGAGWCYTAITRVAGKLATYRSSSHSGLGTPTCRQPIALRITPADAVLR